MGVQIYPRRILFEGRFPMIACCIHLSPYLQKTKLYFKWLIVFFRPMLLPKYSWYALNLQKKNYYGLLHRNNLVLQVTSIFVNAVSRANSDIYLYTCMQKHTTTHTHTHTHTIINTQKPGSNELCNIFIWITWHFIIAYKPLFF